MKVIIAIPCLNRGGTEMQTLYLTKAILRSGHSVGVVCYFEQDPLVVDEYRATGCDVFLMGLDRSIGPVPFMIALRGFLLEQRPDLVHIQYMTPGALAVAAVRLAGIRRVFATVHQPYSAWHKSLWKLLLRLSALLCEHFVAVSLYAERSWFGTCRDFADCQTKLLPRHFTIHNAVDVARVDLLVRSEEALLLEQQYRGAGRFVFGYVGRLSHEKGVDILLDAFAQLAARHPFVGLLIVGDGPDQAALEARCRNGAGSEREVFTGRQSWDDAMRHFAAMDAVVVPSRFEGFGLSAVEAMSATKPVIASDTGGLAEIIENGKNGLLFENGNVSRLVAGMERLLVEPEIRRRLALDAWRRASDFDVERFNRKIRKLYNPPYHE